MSITRTAVLTLASVGLTVSLRAGEIALGTPVSQLVHEVLADVEVTFKPHQIGEDFDAMLIRRAEAGEHFDATLNRLAEADESSIAAEAEEGQDIASKLVVIAMHRREKPHLYEAIRGGIVEAKMSWQASQQAPRLSPWAWSVEYRLVWEYFLMRPPSRATLPLHDHRAIEALERIADERSLLTLVTVYKIAARHDNYGKPVQNARQLEARLLPALGFMRTRAGLRAILDCLAASDERTALVPEGTLPEWNPRAVVFEFLTYGRSDAELLPWRKVVAEFPREDLSQADIELLDRVERHRGPAVAEDPEARVRRILAERRARGEE